MGKTTSLEQWLDKAQGAVPQCLVVFSDEPLFVTQASDAYRRRARENSEIQRHVIDFDRSFDPASFVGLFSEGSLFGDISLVDARITQPKLLKDQATALAEVCTWIGQSQTDHRLLVTGPSLNKTQRKSAGFADLLAIGCEVVCPQVSAESMPRWVSQTALRMGLQLDKEAVLWLSNRTEGNLLAAYQAMEKLTNEHTSQKVTFEMVEQIVSDSSRHNVFELGANVLRGDTKRVVKMLDGLQSEGQPATMVLWCLTEEIRAVTAVSEALRKGQRLDEACRNNRVWGPRKDVIGQALKRHNRQSLSDLNDLCYRAEKAIKGMGPGDPWILLEMIGLGICGISVPKAWETAA